jgi:hypothetical protein
LTNTSTERATYVAARADRQRERVERRVDAAHRARLRLLAELGRGRVLALGEAVDPVVEHHHVDVDVAPEQVNEVVAADGQRVAVAGDEPDAEVGARRLEAGRERGRAAVDGVKAVRLHVVREPLEQPMPLTTTANFSFGTPSSANAPWTCARIE